MLDREENTHRLLSFKIHKFLTTETTNYNIPILVRENKFIVLVVFLAFIYFDLLQS